MLIHINKVPATSIEKSVNANTSELENSFAKNTAMRAVPLPKNKIVKSLPICSLGSFREVGIFKDYWFALDKRQGFMNSYEANRLFPLCKFVEI